MIRSISKRFSVAAGAAALAVAFAAPTTASAQQTFVKIG